MLTPPNRFSQISYVIGYLSFSVHGVFVWSNPPGTLVPFIGWGIIVWAFAAIIGGVLSAISHITPGAKLAEVIGLGVISLAISIYLFGVSGASAAGDVTGRLPQYSILISFLLLVVSRGVSLLVARSREVMLKSLVTDLETKFNNADKP